LVDRVGELVERNVIVSDGTATLRDGGVVMAAW
jgi:hypothetical protein